MENREAVIEELARLEQGFTAIIEQFRGCFKRRLGFEVVKSYVKGCLSKVERKNSWQLAESIGEVTPYKFQNMLHRGSFNEEAARDLNQKILVEQLGKGGIYAVDETGFIKKGKESAGVKRQYSGTAGRIENSQIGVFASYKTEKGHCLVDRALYIPAEWIQDKERCRKAGIPEGQAFHTKPALASGLYNRFREQGHEASWVVAGEAYGKDPDFIQNLERQNQPYVLAVPKNTVMRVGMLKREAESWSERIPEDENGWQRVSCGDGSKGKRWYDWGWIGRGEKCREGFVRGLLIRRSTCEKRELGYYAVYAKAGTGLEAIVAAAGARWSVEECFESAKGETGLDQYEVRSWQGWHRHMTLSMIAFTILCVSRVHLLYESSEGKRMEGFKKKRQVENQKYR